MPSAAVRAALTPRWASDPLWRRAQQVPAFDLDFTRRSIIDRIGGISGTFTRPSSTQVAWNGSQFVEYAANQPAFEFVPSTGLWGLRMSPAATNGFARSGQFASGAGWTPGTNTSVEVGVQSLGELTGNRVTRLSNAGNNLASQGSSIAAGQVTTWVIASGSHEIGIRVQNIFPDRADGVFNLANGTSRGASVAGTATGASTYMYHFGGGLYLCALTATMALSNASAFIGPTDASLSVSVWPNSSTVLSSITVFHSQIETGPLPTSPTITSGLTVTRSADSFIFSGNAELTALLRSGDLTVYTEHIAQGWNGSNQFIVSLDNSAAATGADEARAFESSTGIINMTHSFNNAPQTVLSFGTGVPGTVSRYAYAMGANSTTGATNRGPRPATDTVCTNAANMDTLIVASRRSGVFRHNAAMLRLAIFRGRMADARLDAMVA